MRSPTTANFLYGVPTLVYVGLSLTFFYDHFTFVPPVCAVQEFTENHKNAIETINGIIDLGMTLSTGLVGLGSAMLVGVYANIPLARSMLFVVFSAIFSLSMSIIYGILWKIDLANIWYNGCPNLISNPNIQDVTDNHFYYMIVGIILIGVTVAIATYHRLVSIRS